MTEANVLYVTYDGILEPLGRSQVLAYAKGLSADFHMILLTFEKDRDLADAERVARTREEVDLAGIEWVALRYHKRPRLLAKAFDLFQGIWAASRLSFSRGARLVHVRSYVSALVGLPVKWLTGCGFIFDMRGLWIDEGVEKGSWTRGSLMYSVGKGFERRYLLSADVVVSLTQAAVKEMSRWPYLEGRKTDFRVIPTCCDLAAFKPQDRTVREAVPDRFVLGYVGNVGTWYNFPAVLSCFKYLREEIPKATLLIVNRDQHDEIWEHVAASGVPRNAIELRKSDHQEVAEQIRRMDASLFFIKPTYAKLGSAPTKLGELLGCGVPCLTNAGVGDMDAHIQRGNVGVLVDFDQLEVHDVMRAAVLRLVALARESDIVNRCNQVAREHFSLETGVERYRSLYRDVLARC